MKDKFKKILHSRTFRGGVYTTAICVACTALAVAVNLFAGALPTSVTRIDMSTNRLFSLSNETKTLCENIDSDITLYYLCGAGEGTAAKADDVFVPEMSIRSKINHVAFLLPPNKNRAAEHDSSARS